MIRQPAYIKAIGALFFVLVVFLLSDSAGTAVPATQETALKNTEATASTTTDAQTTPNTFLVTRIIDGDTIELANGERVRYIGIDTPESVDPRDTVQCFGKEASARNAELVLGKEVRLVKDVRDRDRYGRLLRYVYVGDLFINKEIIAEGFAHAATFPPDVAHAQEFADDEHEAREAKRGLWSACPAR